MIAVWWFLVTVVLVVGLSTMWWAGVGLVRLLSGAPRRRTQPVRWTHRDVAILMAARNEERVLPATLEAALRVVAADQIFVVSDDSTDLTAAIVREAGANVLELSPNRGKARALAAGLEEFRIPQRFGIVLLLDADTLLAPDYLDTGLPLFDDDWVAAVAGTASTLDARDTGRVGRFLLAHRERTYVAVQTLHKFGQAARRLNAVTIVPGFASMYRTDILEHVDITAPGLAIEDYNMTFEVHSKGLGRVAFDPRAAHAATQDPDSLGDYRKQVRRWSLGFWQTAMRHPVQPTLFWFGLSIFMLEVLLSSVLLLVVPPAAISVLVGAELGSRGVEVPAMTMALAGPALAVLVGMLIPDVLLSLYTATVKRNLRFLAYAPLFPLMRVLDAAMNLRAFQLAFSGSSSGVWSSPARR